MITWIKPNGSEIETADGPNLVEWALDQGWKLKPEVEPEVEVEPEAESTDQDEAEEQDLVTDCPSIEALNAAIDKQTMADIIQAFNGETLDLRGSIETVKIKALKMLEAE